MSAHITPPLEPFIVPAKVLRPGSRVQTTSHKQPFADRVIRVLEIVLMLAFTAACVPFVATGIVWGFLYLIALIGALYLLVTAGILVGLYGVWSLLLRSDATLLANKHLRDQAVSCVVIGIITDAAVAAWACITLSSPRLAPANDLWRVLCILAVPVVVGAHRVWRLKRLMRAQGLFEDGRILLLMRTSLFALGQTLQRLAKPAPPPREAKWGARF